MKMVEHTQLNKFNLKKTLNLILGLALSLIGLYLLAINTGSDWMIVLAGLVFLLAIAIVFELKWLLWSFLAIFTAAMFLIGMLLSSRCCNCNHDCDCN